MAVFHKLHKFCDARGWSLNDIYSLARQNINHPKEGESTPYDDNVYSHRECQVNYSILQPGVIKAWHRHKFQDDYFCVLKGMAQVGVYSDEDGAEKFFVGEHNPGIVHIQAGEWHGLTAVGTEPVGLLYLVTKQYNPQQPDEERAPHDSFVGHDWWLPENI